jgi:surface polysaccharide O-acyltransferase-like enzyme
MQQEKNLEWADNLRVLATLSVIVIHVASSPVSLFGQVDSSLWWTANVMDGFLRFCVPVFVMLSGVLLLTKEYPLAVFLKKRLTRILWPFLFWSAVYITFAWFFKGIKHQGLDASQVMQWVFSLLQKGAAYHLWYIYMILGLYLFIPIIGKWVRQASEKELFYFLGIWFFTLCINYPFLAAYKINIELSYFTGFLGYLVLGYYAATKKFDPATPIKKIGLAMFLIGSAITIFGNYFAALYHGKYVSTFYAYLSPNVFLASFGFLLYIKHCTLSNRIIISLRDFISTYSFGIYLVHVLVLSSLSRCDIHWKFVHPFVGIPVTSVACLLISASIIYLLHKIPLGKYIAG